MTMQITDEKSLRKLLQRLQDKEVEKVKTFIEAVAAGADGLVGTAITDLLSVKKVKENQSMVAVLTEIKEYFDAGNKDAAVQAAKRVLEVKPAVSLGSHSPKRVVVYTPQPEPELELKIDDSATQEPVTEEL